MILRMDLTAELIRDGFGRSGKYIYTVHFAFPSNIRNVMKRSISIPIINFRSYECKNINIYFKL